MHRFLKTSASVLTTIATALLLSNDAGAGLGDCGQPVTGGTRPAASDCLHVLRTAVHLTTCVPDCICDTNGSGDVTAADALLCLTSSVGNYPLEDCSCVDWPGGGEINESCTVCHAKGRAFDVASEHPGLLPIPDVTAKITSVKVDVNDEAETATLTVEFTVTDPDGKGIPNLGIPSSRPDRMAYLRLGLSQLMPPAVLSGDPDTWVSYTTGERNPSNLTDRGKGRYTYVFGTNLYGMYVPSNRHRLLLIISGDVVAQSKNETYDFVPEQLPGPFSFDLSRDIVATSACNECHGRLGSPLGYASFHGGSRYETKACATCHTTALGEGAAEFAPMVHEIHTSQDIPGLEDFSEVTFPQDPRNCTKCHAGPDGSNWKTRPSMTACGSCHPDVDFATGEGHGDGSFQLSNANCALCHTPTRIAEDHLTAISTPNNPEVPEGLVNFEYVLDQVTVNAANEAVVRFHINKDGELLDLSTIPPPGFSGGPSFLVAYALGQDGLAEPLDYNQLGRSAGQPASVSLSTLAGKLTGTPASYTAVLSAAPFPVGATLRAIALQGYFTQLADPNDPKSTNVSRYTASVVRAVDGDTVRREIIDAKKCLNCHESLQLHGGNRVNEVGVCVICHNPNLSSSGRTMDASKTAEDQKELLAEAGYDPDDSLTWPERTQHLKNLVHGIHAAGERAFDYDFVRGRNNGLYYNWSEVTFPGILSNCETCHLPGTFGVEVPAGALVSTEITTDGLNLTSAAVSAARDSVPNPTDLVNSQQAGSCAMCHDNLPAVAHMEQSGGVLFGWRAEALGD